MNREEFLAERRTGLGGSDIAAVCGVHENLTPHDVYLEKIGAAPPRPDTDDGPLARGRALEPLIGRWWAGKTGRHILSIGLDVPTFRHPKHPWAMAHVDALAMTESAAMGYGEFKSLGLATYAKAKREGLPAKYYMQGQWYGGILPATMTTFAGFAVFNAELWGGLQFDVPRDEEMFGEMLQRGEKFWHDHVKKEVPPPIGPVEPIEDIEVITAEEQKLVLHRNDPEWAEAVAQLLEATAIEKEAKAFKEVAVGTCKALMGEKVQIVEGAGVRIFHRPVKAGSVFDEKTYLALRPLDRLKVQQVILDFFGAEQKTEALELTNQLKTGCDLPLSAVQKRKAESRPFKTFPLK